MIYYIMENNQKAAASPKQIYVLATSKNYPKSDKLSEHITNYVNFNNLKQLIENSLTSTVGILSELNNELTNP
jgi:hypothetical protein